MKENEVVLIRQIGAPQLRKPRKDGWNKAKRTVFLRHLAATANVTASAKAVGVTKSAADNLRKRDPGFAAAWLAALAESKETLANYVMAASLGTAELPDYDAAAIAAGDYPEPPEPGQRSPQLALEFLKQLEGNAARPRQGRAPRMAGIADTAQALIEQIDKVRARQRRALGTAPAEVRGDDR